MAATAVSTAVPVARRAVSPRALPALALSALAALSGPLQGLYAVPSWGLAAVAAAVVAIGLLIAGGRVRGRSAAVALGGLALLAVWSLASLLWTGSPGQTWIEVHRAGLYVAVLLVAILSLRGPRIGAVVLGVLTAGSLATTAWVLAQMVASDASGLFAGGRLAEPVGYPGAHAALALIGLWPLIALAARPGAHTVRGAALGGAVLLAGTVVLTQSRAGVAALALTAVLLVVLLPGRLVRAWALAHVAVAVAAALPWLMDVAGDGSAPSAVTLSTAGAALVLAAALAGLLWGIVVPALERPEARRAALGVLAAVAAVGALAGVQIAGDPVGAVRAKAQELTSLAPETTGRSRLTAGGGMRWDLWRVAAGQFAAAPLTGVGAGAYDTTYFRERRQPDPVRQPHSLPLQLLGELGLVGGLALVLLAGGVVAGTRRRLRARPNDLPLVAGAAGICAAWAVQGSVDWLWQLPSLTIAALLAAGILVAPTPPPALGGRTSRPAPAPPPAPALSSGRAASRPGRAVTRPRAGTAARAAAVLALAAFGAVTAQHLAADGLRSSAQAALATDPKAARALARRSVALGPNALASRYVEAAAHARLGDYGAARSTLLKAAAREPADYVPWTLLGDLAVRRGDAAAARAAYGRAAALNPLDASLAALARDPAAALRP